MGDSKEEPAASEEKPDSWLAQEELMRQAQSPAHLYDHRVFNPYCKHCCRAKAQRKRRVKGTLDLGPAPEHFGEQTTGDHLISRKDKIPVADVAVIATPGDDDDQDASGDEDESSFLTKDARDAVVMYDRGTATCSPKPRSPRLTRLRHSVSGQSLMTTSSLLC